MAEKADLGTETRKVSKDEAAFILGQGGKTKAKLCAVSGAQIDLLEGRGKEIGNHLQIRGTTQQRRAARKYIEFVVAQRLGPVKIADPSAHDDLTILVVPADTVSFITGKQGSFLRLIEDEWSCLLFFLEVNPKKPPTIIAPGSTERLAIFGPGRRRRGAQLKVMAAVEAKHRGYFTKNVGNSESSEEGFATDTIVMKEEDCSYALGRNGATRKRLARASSCIVEYVDLVAYFCGVKKERTCAKEYFTWLLQQRVGGKVHVDHKGRDDVTLIMLPANSVGLVNGYKGSALRAMEEETNTFCFIEDAQGEDQKPLLIFGCLEDRCMAENLVWERMSGKTEEPSTDYGGKNDRKGKGFGKSAKGGKSKDKDHRDLRAREEVPEKKWAPREPKEGESIESMDITDIDAAFLMGPGGRTKRKLANVSGADIDLKTHHLDIIGTPEERAKAKKYIQLVTAQRSGPVRIEDLEEHDDLTIMEVPAEAVSFVTGKQGSFLRLVEEEFGTLLFFIDFNKTNKRDQNERLAIFGTLRERRGAELKVMAAIELKHQGYYTKPDSKLPQLDPLEGFRTDRLVIEEDDFSYALGKGGATRKKIARASNCVIEYIGRTAYLSGMKVERMRAREYLGWLFKQRVGSVEVDYSSRNDVTVMQVPKDCVGFVTGYKGASLRAVEEKTGTFCFIEGGRDDPNRDPKPLLLFGNPENRKQAEDMLRKRIDQKLVEGWVHEDGHDREDNGKSYGGKTGDKVEGKGKGKGKKSKDGASKGEKGKDAASGGVQTRPSSGPASSSSPVAEASTSNLVAAGGHSSVPGPAEGGLRKNGKEQQPVLPKAPARNADEDDDDDGAWGDWGGGSSDEDASASNTANSKANLNLVGAQGKWGSSPYSGTIAATMSSPQRAAGGSGAVNKTGHGYSPARVGGEDIDLPPHLMQEEAWPELGQMGSKKRSK
eukprot:TRINITY_DN14620_c0_g1_i3.p1 TRINITY_DN14620_c0_g1~~TRINITY_DN14620_c0_g1_i3.p1  ORF type:complete len:941 (+),score=223.07 TRINITY_DN14620_c0_g1_i3:170-2992(+)